MRLLWRAACAAVCVWPLAAAADTLPQALEAAYETNPEIAEQRAVVRQFDEGVPQARSAGLPGAEATLQGQQSGTDFLRDDGRVFNGGVSLSQSLYRGGRTRIATSAAEKRILAARARLRATENRVMLNVVTAYADVLRFQRVVELNENQVKVLGRERQQSSDRFEVGDLTRTDVAQAEARLALARSDLIISQGQLSTARQAYRRVVGRPPVDLAPVPPLPPLPGTAGQATDLANRNNPLLIAARFDEAAARDDVAGIERERLPSIGAQVGAQYQRFDGGGSSGNFVRQGEFITQSLGVQATIPLYQAGLVGSRVREAQARRSQLLEVIGATGRQIDEEATNAFVQLNTARAAIAANQVAVDANALALEGVKQENQVGTRTVIEVLNAEQELLQVQVNLATARREEYVAGYALLAAVGQAEAGALGVPVEAYDVEANARAVRKKWWDADYPAGPPALPLPPVAAATRSVTIGPR